MNILQKTLLIILGIFLFISSCLSYGNLPMISKISYDGYLGEDTIIQIEGYEFKNCKNYKVNGKDVKIKSIEDKKITYLFGENKFYSGNFTFTCNSTILSTNFYFPYISGSDISKLHNDGIITLRGKNLNNKPSVSFKDGKKLSSIDSGGTSLSGKVPGGMTSDDVYISSNGLKSNLFNLGIKIPEINYITTTHGFKVGEKIYIHGKNLNKHNNTIVNFGSEEVTNFKSDKFGTVYFNIPDKVGTISISIVSNGISSNIVKIDVLDSIPYIKSGYESYETVEKNGESVLEEKILIIGENFTEEEKDIKGKVNGKTVTVEESDNKKITLEGARIYPGNNFVTITKNGQESNTYNLYKKGSAPFITYVEADDIVDNKRRIYVGVGNFDIEKHTIYFGNSSIKPDRCSSSKCTIYLDINKLEGEFSIRLDNGYKSLPEYLNIENTYSPVITKIEFDGEFQRGTSFEITGKNFTNADLTITNLVDKSSNGGYEIDVIHNKITGKIGNIYNIDKSSRIQIKKYGKTSSIDFKGIDVESNIIEGVGIIYNLKIADDSKLIIPGTKVEIIGKGFHRGDIINIGKSKVPIIYSREDLSYFIVPLDIEEGKYDLKLENNRGKFSNTYKTFINGKKSISEISLISNTDIKSNFETNTIYNKDNIYSILLGNRANDITIGKMIFQIDNSDSEYELGTFILSIDGKEIGESIINSKGEIIFKEFVLKKDYEDYEITLSKGSPFIYKGDYSIILKKVTAYIEGTNIEIKNINLNKLTSNNFLISNKFITKCFDSIAGNVNCNGYYSGITTTNTKNNTSTIDNNKNSTINKQTLTSDDDDNKEDSKKETVKEPENKLLSIYERIDELTAKIITKKEKLELKDQLNFYKDFRLKLKNLLAKYNNSKYYKYYEYYYDIFDREYKSVFKEYILSK